MNATASLAASITNFQLGRVASAADWDDVLRAFATARSCSAATSRKTRRNAYGDGHDLALHAMTFLLRRNGHPAGTTRTMLSASHRRWPVPATAVFQREIDAALGADATFIEMNLTAVGPAPQDDPRTALFHLFKAAVVHSMLENADWVITAVRDNRIGFHGRMFNMQILSGPETLAGARHRSACRWASTSARGPMRILEKRIPGARGRPRRVRGVRDGGDQPAAPGATGSRAARAALRAFRHGPLT